MDEKIKEKKRYYENGNLEEHSYWLNGQITGEYRWWWKNGNLREHSQWVNGQRHGECKTWHENGNLRIQSYWLNDKKHGECKLWHENGNLHHHSYWLNNRNITEQQWFLILKLIRSLKIKCQLRKYFLSRSYIEWWYHPNVKGGKLAKQDIETFINNEM